MCLSNSKGNSALVSSVFTLAFGSDANFNFLKELAARNGGSARQIYDTTDASSQLQDFYASIASPLLKDVSVTFDYQQVLPLLAPLSPRPSLTASLTH